MKKDRTGLIILIAAFLLAALLIPLSCPGSRPPVTEPATETTSPPTTSRKTTSTTTTTISSPPTEPVSVPEEEEPEPEDREPSLSDLFAAVSPSVVSVHVSIPASSLYAKREEFFSGLIVDESGIIVTTFSLLERALDFRGNLLADASIRLYVRGFDQAFEAVLIGYQSTVDLALLRVKDRGDVTFPAQTLDKEARLAVGTPVYSIGYPPVLIGEGGLSSGCVTSLYRTSFEEDGSPVGLIETSIPTLPVYAGSPLINDEGRVVAIASGYLKRIYTQHLGYAVPSPIVLDVISRILDQPDPLPEVKASLGITVLGDEDNEALRKMFNYPAGLYINLVKPESAAYTAGLNAGDILLRINGQAMEAVSDLMAFLGGQAVGTLVEMEVYRPGDDRVLVKTCYLLEESP
ncbi:MAG TPA: S1C family serine protease [Bacillota bacterium]|nr:serine protease [Fastidiosipila sp.]HPX92908.1 S1C family serine protease [Bacillota bacterium]HQB80702.1 S1C family serine protease [Bacillota bacterium]